MGVPNILVYTHDSIGQGEDGPPTSRSNNWQTWWDTEYACLASG